jgi:membrane-bound inhibitor of C-type lysozyme
MRQTLESIMTHGRKMLASFFILGLGAGSANAAPLAGQWVQTGSNAGYCSDCSLTIERASDFSPMLHVTANNGWQAQVTLSGYGTETANGFGRWDSNIGGLYAGSIFEVSLQNTGNILKLNMRHLDDALPGTVTATFRKRSHPSRTSHQQPDSSYPYQAASWGGIVRAGPGMHFDRVTSLFERETITIVSRTDEIMNGYPWMQIEYRDGRHGYQWGGIVCATDYQRSDLHEMCDPTPTVRHQAPTDTPKREVARYRCNDGSILDIRLDNRAAETLAIVERNNVTNYLVQIRSASGSLYSNGIVDLHTKANFALLTDETDTNQCKIIDDLQGWAYSIPH